MSVFDNDRELLNAFRTGERQALRAIYEHYLDDVMTLIRCGFVSGEARVGAEPDRTAQLDLAHEVFVHAFRESARMGFDGLRPYRPYLMRIAKNRIIDRLRKARPELELEESHLEPAPPKDEDDLDFKRRREATVAWLATQDEETQRFVELRFNEGLGQAKVAAEMNVTRRRVRTLEERAQADLTRYLAQIGLYP